MGKRCLSVLLVLALCLAGIPAAVFADESSPAGESSPEPVLPFNDVKPGDWHYEHIRIAYINGIVTGMTPTTYVPEGNLTHAQIMVMSANLHSKQKKDDYDFQAHKKDGEPWYQVFEDYCKAEGIIDDRFDGRENENTTRGEVSFYFAHTMTPESYGEGNSVNLSDIENEPYRKEIEKLALTDIVGGFPDGTYRPDELVTRGQASVFVRNTIDVIEELEEETVPEETPADDTAHKNRKKGSRSEEQEDPEITAPEITAQPEDVTVDEGSRAGFAVMVSGSAITYQWQVSADGTVWSDATDEGNTTNTLTVTATADNNGYQYRCVVTNTAGSVTSDPAVLTVILTPPEPEEPEITAQPEDATVDEGSSAAFTVAASGSDLTYQWEVSADGTAWADATDEGSTTDTLTVTATENNNGYQYRCIVSNTAGSVTSDPAVLTVTLAPPEPEEPEITAQPEDATVDEGISAEFVVAASGAELTYQWQVSADGTAWADATDEGSTTNTLTVTATANNDGCQYRCIVSNTAGSVTSDPAVLTVTLTPPGPEEPEITAQPQDATVDEGSNAEFTVAASGSELTYQWEYSSDGGATWADSTAGGSTTATLTVTAEYSNDGYQYRCTVTNTAGSVTSDPAVLTVTLTPVNPEKPEITTQPQDATVDEDSSAEFVVAASGTDLTYQWQVSADGTAWAEATDEGSKTNTLTVTAAADNNGYQYRCTVTNTAGSVTSDPAVLSVTPRGVKIDSDNFPDETFRENYVRSFDLGGNGYLSDAEIAAVKGINCTSKGIATLQGVEFFTALKNLNCSGSSLTSLNVSGNSLTSLNVSGCTALENLNCSGNSLWSLNVSGCTVLDTLDCHSNDLQSLDVSTCTALDTLDCHSNDLQSLDVSGCTALDTLDCHSNDLQSLDVSVCVGLVQLFCHDNPLAGLNVSGCTALADAIVAGNRSDCDSYWEYAKDSALLRVGKDVVLTPADWRPYVEINEDHFSDENFRRVVSGFDSDSDGWLSQADLVAATVMDCSAENIANIDGIAFFTALTTLDCSNNQLMELDVSNSKGLKKLVCSNNMLSSLDLNGNPALTTLDCNWNALESLNVSSCSALTTLDCYANRMEELDLSGCTALTELVCRSAHLKSLTISGKTALTTLDCRNNEITTLSVTDCPALTSVLFTGNDLKSLDLSGCTALPGVNFGSSETGGALETADLSGCTTLIEVSCTDRNLVSLDLSGCSSLKTVSCFNNKMTSLDVSGCTALTVLDCSINSISTLDVSDSSALCDAITLGVKSGTDIVTYSYNGATLKMNSTVSLTPSDPNQ